MLPVDVVKALASDRRLQILSWLKEPRAHFPPQVDGDLVRDGVCGVLIAQKLGISQPTASEHLKVLSRRRAHPRQADQAVDLLQAGREADRRGEADVSIGLVAAHRPREAGCRRHFATWSATCSPIGRWPATSSPSSRRRPRSRPAPSADRARDQLRRDGVRASSRRRRLRARPHLHALDRAALRRPPRARDRHRGGGESAVTKVVLETGSGLVPVALERLTPRGGSGGCSNRCRPSLRFRRPPTFWRPWGGDHPGFPSSSMTTDPDMCTWPSRARTRVARLQPDFGALRRLGPLTVNCFAGSGLRWKTRMFAPALGTMRIPPAARRRVRWPAIWRATASSPSARRSRSRKGPRSPPERAVRARQGSRDRIQAVEVAGAAVIIGNGEFHLDPPES